MNSPNGHVPGDIDSFTPLRDSSDKQGEKPGKDPDITLCEFLERLLWKLLAGTAVALVAAFVHPHIVGKFIADPEENLAAAVLLFNLDIFTYILLGLFLFDPKSPGWPFVEATIAFFATKLSPFESPIKVEDSWNCDNSELQCTRCRSGRNMLSKGPDPEESLGSGLSGFNPEASSTPRTAQSGFLDRPDIVRDYHCDSQEFTVLTSGSPSPEATSTRIDEDKRTEFKTPSCVLILGNPPTVVGHETLSDGNTFPSSQPLPFDGQRLFNVFSRAPGPAPTLGEKATSPNMGASAATYDRGQAGPVHEAKLKDEKSAKIQALPKSHTVCASAGAPKRPALKSACPSSLDASAPEFKPRSVPTFTFKQPATTSLKAGPVGVDVAPSKPAFPTSENDMSSASSAQCPATAPPPFEFTFTMKTESRPASPQPEMKCKTNDFPCIYPSTLSPTNAQPAFSQVPKPAASRTEKPIRKDFAKPLPKVPAEATSPFHPTPRSGTKVDSQPVSIPKAKPPKVFPAPPSSSNKEHPKPAPVEKFRTGLRASIHAPQPATSPAIVVTPSTPEDINPEAGKKPFDPVIARPTSFNASKPIVDSAPAKMDPANEMNQSRVRVPTAASFTFTPPQSPPPISVQTASHSFAGAQLLVPVENTDSADEQRGRVLKTPISKCAHSPSTSFSAEPLKRHVPRGPRPMVPARSVASQVEVLTEKKEGGVTKVSAPTVSQPSQLPIKTPTAVEEDVLASASIDRVPVKAQDGQDNAPVVPSTTIAQSGPAVSVMATCPLPAQTQPLLASVPASENAELKEKTCGPNVAKPSTAVQGPCSTPRRAPQSMALANKSAGRSPGLRGSIWATNILALSSKKAATTTQADMAPPISVPITTESQPSSSLDMDAPSPVVTRAPSIAVSFQAPVNAAIPPPEEARSVNPRNSTQMETAESSSTTPLTQPAIANVSISPALRNNQLETKPILDRSTGGPPLSKNKADTTSTDATRSIKPVAITDSNASNSAIIEQPPNSYVTPKNIGTVLEVPGAPMKSRQDAQKHGPRKSDPGSRAVVPPSTGNSKEPSESREAKNAFAEKTKSAGLRVPSSDTNEQFQSNAAATKASDPSGPPDNSTILPNGSPIGAGATLQNLIKKMFTSSAEPKISPEASSGKSSNERINGENEDDVEWPGVAASMWAPGRADKPSVPGSSRAPADAKIGAWRSRSVALKRAASFENWRARDTLRPVEGKK